MVEPSDNLLGIENTQEKEMSLAVCLSESVSNTEEVFVCCFSKFEIVIFSDCQVLKHNDFLKDVLG